MAPGKGRPLEPDVRADMEARLGQDFSAVRIYDDSKAHKSAGALNASAYTVGTDVVFQRGSYQPASPTGLRLLAHELTHVMQQRNGPVEGAPTVGGVKVSDPSDRFERDAETNAALVMNAAEMTAIASSSAHQRTAGRVADHRRPGQPGWDGRPALRWPGARGTGKRNGHKHRPRQRHLADLGADRCAGR